MRKRHEEENKIKKLKPVPYEWNYKMVKKLTKKEFEKKS
jgi:hypothetical protein